METQIKYNKAKGERNQAEKDLNKCRRELKKLTEYLSQNKAKEQQEMQLLSEMLSFTVSPRQQSS